MSLMSNMTARRQRSELDVKLLVDCKYSQEELREAPPLNLKMNTRGSNGASKRQMMGQLLAKNIKYEAGTLRYQEIKDPISSSPAD